MEETQPLFLKQVILRRRNTSLVNEKAEELKCLLFLKMNLLPY